MMDTDASIAGKVIRTHTKGLIYKFLGPLDELIFYMSVFFVLY